jgi:cell division protease FtsH
MWAVIILLMVVLFNLFNQPPSSRNQLSYSSLMQEVHNGRVSEVLIQGQNISGRMSDGTLFSAYAPFDPTMVEELMKNNVNVKAEPREESPWYMTLLVSWLPMLLLVGIWVFFMRQMQGGGGKAMSFGRSRARMISQDSAKVTFDDVAGVDEAKEELTEVVDFLSNPKKFTRLGGRIPTGILLVGSPGTGKTLLAKAVAGEAGVPFFSISGSDFVEMFVGVGASRVRDLFAQGKKNAPCLIFIDEIDAVGRQRGAGLGGGHDEREQTLNQLLVEMDGFEANEGVILIAATNRPDVLDPALLRPGRFDRQVVVPTPDVRGRKRILEVHSRRAPLAPDVDLDRVARSTPGMSGADLENLVNEAALLAAKQNKDFVAMNDFEEAKDKLIMGKARRTMVLSDNEKRNTAYHEAGHAIVSKFMPESNPVHKITIIPRGRALGFTAYVPEEDKYSVTRTELEGRIAMALGGRAAELIIFGKYTSGAMQDIKMATQTARQMVCELGMSEVIGPVAIGESNSEVFIGREWVATKNHSEETSRIVDSEVKRIINEGMSKAETILREHKDILHKTAEALLEYETISGEDLAAIIKGEAMPVTLQNGDSGKGGNPENAAESSNEFKLEE